MKTYIVLVLYMWHCCTVCSESSCEAGNAKKVKAAQEKHYPGLAKDLRYDPKEANACWLVSDYYINLYSRAWKIPLVVSYKFNLSPDATNIKRNDAEFKEDERLRNKLYAAKDADYKDVEPYNRGHLANAGDFKSSEEAYASTFLLSNIAPQDTDFNRDEWGDIEKEVHNIAKSGSNTYIITGIIVSDKNKKTKSGIVIPTKFYKIMATCTCKKEKVIKYWICNNINKPSCESNSVNDDTVLGFKIDKNKICPNKVESQLNRCNSQNGILGTLRQGVSKSLKQKVMIQEVLKSDETICKYIKKKLSNITPARGVAKTILIPKGTDFQLFDLLPRPSGIDISTVNFPLKSISYDCDKMEIAIKTTPVDKLSLVPGVIEVYNIVFFFKASLNRDNLGLTYLSMTANWNIASITTQITINYNLAFHELEIKGKLKSAIPVNLDSIIKTLTGTSLAIPLPSFTLHHVTIAASIDTFKGGDATIALSGSINSNRVHAIFHKSVGSGGKGKYSVAFAADLASFKLSTLLHKTIGANIRNIPFFDSLIIPRLGFIISTGYIDTSLVPDIYFKDSLLRNSDNEIYKGFWSYSVIKFKNGQQVPMILSYTDSTLKVEVADGGKLTFNTLISSIPGVTSVRLPPGVPNIMNTAVEQFQLNIKTGVVIMEIDLPNKLSYFDSKLTISNAMVMVIAKLKHPRSFAIDVTGDIKIGGANYDIAIASQKGKYVFTAVFKKLSFKALSNKLSADSIPGFMRTILKRFLDFEMHNAMISFPLSAKPLQIHLSGTPVISGYKRTMMNLLIIRSGSKTHIIQGYEFENTNLLDVARTVSGQKNLNIGILNQDLDIAVVISPINYHGDITFDEKLLREVPIIEGASLSAHMGWPSTCSSDTLCKVCSGLIGPNMQFILQGTFQRSSTTLAATLKDINLGGGVLLRGLGLFIQTGLKSKVGLKASLVLQQQRITLHAEIGVSRKGVELAANMAGCWHNAFNAKWLSICHLRLVIGVSYSPPFISALEFGGEFHIGNRKCVRHPIIIRGYFGIDRLDPKRNYFYLEVKGKFTLQSILKAFCVTAQLPKPVGDSGFPRGFVSSYSVAGIYLPRSRLTIQAGYIFKGAFSIFGLTTYADIAITPTGIRIKIILPVLNIANGLLKMGATPSLKKGPFLHAEVSQQRRHFEASGYISVLGFSVHGRLKITDTYYEYYLEGKMLHVFYAKLHIYASYGSISSASFKVDGYFKSDLFRRIYTTINNFLTQAANKATAKITAAQNHIRSKKVLFHRAADKIKHARHNVDSKHADFDRAVNKLRHFERKVDSICRYKHCGSVRVCIPCGIQGFRCVTRVWGACIIWLPRIKICCSHIRNPICLAANAACWLLKEPIKALIRGAAIIVDKSRHLLEVAKLALRVAEKIVRSARHVLDIAIAALEGVKVACRAGIQALKFVNKALFTTLDIQEISFHTSLSAANGGVFKVNVKVLIFNHLKSLNIHFNIRNPLHLIMSLAVQLVGGLFRFLKS